MNDLPTPTNAIQLILLMSLIVLKGWEMWLQTDRNKVAVKSIADVHDSVNGGWAAAKEKVSSLESRVATMDALILDLKEKLAAK